MNKIPSPIVQIKEAMFSEKAIQLYIKRDDLNHPRIQGNKYWKLYYNIQAAKNLKHHTLLTFGGAYSNHIYATAAAGKSAGLKTIGIIRGEASSPLNPTLRNAINMGMQLHFVSRAVYKTKTSAHFLEQLQMQYGKHYVIPEGGTNHLAIDGCQLLAKEIQQQGFFDKICIPVGTGGTIAGLITGYNNESFVLGFSSLKGDFLSKEVESLILTYNQKKYYNWKISNDFHFGGYARHQQSLIDFINHFNKKHNILLEPIYTGKMMFGIYKMIQNKEFKPGSKILAIHTGGLQGVAGFNERNHDIIQV